VGGGLLVKGELTLVDCQISDNHANNTGSAMYSTGSGAILVLSGALINNNTAGDGKHIVFNNSAQLMMQGINQIQN